MAEHWLVAPPLDGPITGGTLYNRFLAEALERLGDRVIVVDTVEACGGFPWVDSLYLPRVAEHWTKRPMGLLAHYLPSVFELRADLESFETAALRDAARVVCTGSWMRDEVVRLGARREDTWVVEPGVSESAPVLEPEPGPVTATLVGTVTARKGVLALIEALSRAGPTKPWRLQVLGDMQADPDYASSCKDAAAALPVSFLGAVSPPKALELIARSHVLISAARIESYGMAIAEAQACGVPVLARPGGHVERLVARVPSGRLVDDDDALARAFASLVAAPDELARLREVSRANRPRRPWLDAAREFRAVG